VLVKRLLGLLLPAFASPLLAATIYVDNACPTAGDGTGGYTQTCDGTASGNPRITFSAAIGAAVGGDVIRIRGIHAAHESCPGSTKGRYADGEPGVGNFNNAPLRTVGRSGSAGNPIVIEASGWTAVGAGTQETVYLENTLPASGGGAWTACTDCSAGSANVACQNIPGTCGNVYTSTSGVGAVKADGTPCHHETSAANVIDQYDCKAVSNGLCTGAGAPWACCTNPGAGTCTNQIAVRWAFAPTAEERIIRADGSAIAITNSSYITIRGFTARNAEDTIVAINAISGAVSNIVIQDNKIMYAPGVPSGGDYGVHVTGVSGSVNNITIDRNEIAYTGSEAIHWQPNTAGVATAYASTNNWIHDIGSPTVLGPGIHGTPSGMIIGNNGGGTVGNYTGSVVSGNLITDITQYTNGCCLSLENDVDFLVMRDNICKNPGGPCFKISCTNASCDGDQLFNNICIDPHQNPAGLGALEITGLISNLKVYNNTFKDHAKAYNTDLISFYGVTAGSTGNVVRNNVLWSDRNGRQLNWENEVSGGGTDTVSHNDIFPSGTNPSNLIKLKVSGVLTDYNCSAVAAGCSGNCASSKCADPLFVNASTDDYHLLTGSPAKDAGTATGMPSARTTDINNTVADDHGLQSYADAHTIQNGIWDMGASEVAGAAPVLTISKSESQDPIAAGALLTYTIAYQNTGTASATGVTISDTVPTNTTFSSATAGGTLNAGVVTWTIGTVTAGASASVQLIVAVNSPLSDGTILTNGTYSIASNELATVNGSAVTTTVTSQPVLSITKTDSPDPVTPGSTTITYTLAYSNTGTANATTTVITDTVPAGTTFQSATGGGAHVAGVVTWNIGTVNAGTSSSVQMTVTANSPLQNGTVIHNNTYNIDSDQTTLVSGVDDTTTVSVPAVAGGLQFPLTARTNIWASAQSFKGPSVTATAPTYREISVDPNAIDGGYPTIASALAYIASVPATQAAPWTVRLLPGVYSQAAPLNVPSWTIIRGAGKGVTIIKRTTAADNITYGTSALADPVLAVGQTQGVEIYDLTLLHSGTYSGFGAGASLPVGIFTGAARQLKIERCRLEGTAYGWYDKTDSTDASFPKPVVDGTIGDESYWYTIRDSEVVGHRFGALGQVARHETFAYGTTFLLDIPSGANGLGDGAQRAVHNWEYAQTYLVGCNVVLRSKAALTFSSSGNYGGGVVSDDSSVSNTAVYLTGTKIQIDLTGGGDLNGTHTGMAGIVAGNLATNNTVHCRGCEVTYRSDTITSAPFFGGICVWNFGSSTDSSTAFLSGTSFRDLGGSGATIRADAIVGVSFLVGSLREPKLIEVEGSRISSWSYLVSTGSPSPTHAQFFRTSPSINYQAGTATLASGTSTVTLPVAYPNTGTQVTDYRVSLTCAADEAFNVTGKTNTQFVINSSNTGSAAVCDWTVTR
jgi:uncharacterized repeat protein (TIGR01451 family)